MKIVQRQFVHNGPGIVEMIPIDSEDLWYAYNLISPGDYITEVTDRKILKQQQAVAFINGGSVAARKDFKLEIEVEQIYDFDNVNSVMRVRDKSIMNNDDVKIGACSTLELELNRPFVLRKGVWDSLALEVLQQASDPAATADLAVVLLQEGLSHILLIGKSSITTCSRIETSIPRKHGPRAGYETALNKFYDKVVQAFLKHVDFNVVRCTVIASSGVTKDQFHRHLLLEAERKQLKSIIANKSRIKLVHTAADKKHSVREVLDAPNVMNMIKDTKAAQEVRALEEYFCLESKDSARVCCGPNHVEVAHENMAVHKLLITDDLFRSADISTRQKYAKLVESVKESGGTVHVFSSLHASGEKLATRTGIAAILRFPLPDLEYMEP